MQWALPLTWALPGRLRSIIVSCLHRRPGSAMGATFDLGTTGSSEIYLRSIIVSCLHRRPGSAMGATIDLGTTGSSEIYHSKLFT